MKATCHFCQLRLSPVHADFARCPGCSLFYYLAAESTAYEDDYFDQEYRNQYGCSYLEDKAKIQARMADRINTWQHFSQPGASCLEIGSAAGFFLEILINNSHRARGWEVSKTMSDFANNHGCETTQGDFFRLYQNHRDQKAPAFDTVFAFYVIEHFADQLALWQALQHLVRPGGHLVLATPSVFGPLYYFHRQQFFDTHPADHFVDYSPHSLRNIGQKFDFRLVHSSPEGIHPGRFILGNLTMLHGFFGFLQKTFAFSDTVFTIFEKNP